MKGCLDALLALSKKKKPIKPSTPDNGSAGEVNKPFYQYIETHFQYCTLTS